MSLLVVHLRIDGYAESNMAEIQNVADLSIPWRWLNTNPGKTLVAYLVCSVRADSFDDLFLQNLFLNICTANDGYCVVQVRVAATDGERLYSPSKEDFYRLLLAAYVSTIPVDDHAKPLTEAERIKVAQALYREGILPASVARILGVSEEIVQQDVTVANLPKDRGSPEKQENV